MGFEKYYLPEVNDLVRQIKSKGLTSFLNDHRRVEAFIGTGDSIKIMDTITAARKHAMPDNKIMETLVSTYPEHFK